MPKPLIHGGGQEKGHRSGTENVVWPSSASARRLWLLSPNSRAQPHRPLLRDRLENGMRLAAPDVDHPWR